MNVADALPVTAGRHGDRTAVKLDAEQLSYRALDLASARVAGLLRDRGIAPGDRVAVMLPNVCEFAVVHYGVLRSGSVVVPLDPLLRQREVASHLGDSGARLLVAWHAVAEQAEAGARRAGTECLFVTPVEFGRLLATVAPERPVRSRAGADTAAILYTSATTGTPEGAELTHANLISGRDAVIRLYGLDEGEVTLVALALHDAWGQTCAPDATIAVGGTLSLIARPAGRDALAAVARDRVTLLVGEPALYAAMLAVPEGERGDTSSLRACVSGGAPASAELLRDFEAAFGCPILERAVARAPA
jgi:long-chain acyl-CoA synthetase